MVQVFGSAFKTSFVAILNFLRKLFKFYIAFKIRDLGLAGNYVDGSDISLDEFINDVFN